MRLASHIGLAALLLLASGIAAAQTEDEQTLETIPVDQGTDSAPPSSGEASGDASDDELDEQVFYSGLGVSRVETDFANLGEAVNLDITLGFRVPTVKWVGLEVDIGQTVIPGEYRDPQPGTPPGPPCGPGGLPPGCGTPGTPGEAGASDPENDEFAMQALGLSLAFKSTGRFYAIGKYGYRYINTSNETVNEADRSSTGFGVGAGYRWGRGLSGVELTYKELAESVDSIGLTFFARFNR